MVNSIFGGHRLLENRLTLHLYGRILNVGIWALGGIAILVPMAALLYFAIASDSDDYWEKHHRDGLIKHKSNNLRIDHAFADEVIFSDIQSLWIPLPRVKQHLLFLEYNDRPDCFSSESLVLMGLVGSKEERFVREGEKVYFECQDQEKIEFSDKPTPFWAEFKLNESGGLDVDLVTNYLDSKDQEIYKSTSIFTIEERQKKSLAEIKGGPLEAFAEPFVDAKLYSPDQLISLYGGDDYSLSRDNYRLTLTYGERSEHLFVQKGDLLVLEKGVWILAKGKTQGKPLAKVKSIHGRSVEVVMWDEKGISSANLILPIVMGANFSAPILDVFHKLYKRTKTSVMCDLSGKSSILRKGDWVVKQGKKWRSLRSLSDMKDFLGYALMGELFIFDGIESREGSNYFTGHYFNNERTQVLKVDLKLNEKNQKIKETSQKSKQRRSRLIPTEVEGAA